MNIIMALRNNSISSCQCDFERSKLSLVYSLDSITIIKVKHLRIWVWFVYHVLQWLRLVVRSKHKYWCHYEFLITHVLNPFCQARFKVLLVEIFTDNCDHCRLLSKTCADVWKHSLMPQAWLGTWWLTGFPPPLRPIAHWWGMSQGLSGPQRLMVLGYLETNHTLESMT